MDKCPPDPHLKAFLAERLSPAVCETLEEHLAGCTRCQQRLQELTNDPIPEPWRELLTHGPERDSPADAAWIRRLEGLSPPALLAESVAEGKAKMPSGNGSRAEGGTAPAAWPIVPGYEVLGELGRGGMGVIYKARQTGLNRIVALKMILAGAHASPEAIGRFRREAEAVARLVHPHIVQIYDVGAHDGEPFFSLEYVEGGNLAERLNGTPLPARRAAELTQTLAQAIEFAHQQGIVHRDLTPSNVLLTADGTPKISDFGLAKFLFGGDASPTRTGTVLGTPSYMAPEQAQANKPAVGPATDVYALGAILYELLTGRPPFNAETPLHTALQVVSQEPVPPSRLHAKVPHDLETICLTCLHKEPSKRYRTAQLLADDLGRFLQDQPIRARRAGAVERCWRWCRRNPIVATQAAAVAVLVVTLISSTLIQNSQLSAALRVSDAASREAKERLWESLRDRAQALRMSRRAGQRVDSLRSIQEAMHLPLPPGHSMNELRTEAIAALALPDVEMVHEWAGMPANTVGLAFDGNLERYAWLATDGTVSLRRVSDDTEIYRWHEPAEGVWLENESNLRFSLDGRFLSIRHPASGRLVVLQLAGSEPVRCFSGTQAQGRWAMDFSPDSKWFAYLLTDTRIAVVDLTSGQVHYLPPTGVEQRYIKFAPDGRRFALGVRRADKSLIEVRDAATGHVQQTLPHPTEVTHPAWHPDGRTLATCCDDHLIRLWDVPTGELLRVLKGHKNLGLRCAFTHTGDRLVSNDWHDLLRVWELSSGRQLFSFPAAGFSWMRVSPDDRISAYNAVGRKLQVLRLYRGREYRTINLGGSNSSRAPAGSSVVHPDGRLLAAAIGDGSLSLVDLMTGREVVNLPSRLGLPLRWQPSGDLLTAGTGGFVRWPVRQSDEGRGTRDEKNPSSVPRHLSLVPRHLSLFLGPPEPLVSNFRFRGGCATSADGRCLAIPNFNRGAVVLHRDPSAPTITLQPQQDVRHCAVSPDGRWVATGSHGNTDGLGAKVWEAATGTLVKELHVPGSCMVAFSPDGRWLLTTGGGCRLWEVGSWNEGPNIGGPGGCFAPDGRLLAVEDSAGAIRLVHAENGTELARLEAPAQTRLGPSCFTPDGACLIATGLDTRALHVWDLRAIRQGLAELGLDIEMPPYASANEGPAAPLQVTVDLGN
jgi:serine/threonine protein kinase/WD40 repeat protein